MCYKDGRAWSLLRNKLNKQEFKIKNQKRHKTKRFPEKAAVQEARFQNRSLPFKMG